LKERLDLNSSSKKKELQMDVNTQNKNTIFFKLFVDRNTLSLALNTLIVVGIFGAIFSFTAKRFENYIVDWGVVVEFLPRVLEGFKTTLILSIFSLFLSIFIGLIIYLGKVSNILFVRFFSTVYSEIIIGTPLLVQVIIIYYFIGTAFRIENRYFMGVLILSVFSGAFVSEIFKAGIDSIDKTQWEAATSLGFNKVQKYYYIILPQVFRRILPPLAGQLALLVKSSSLLSVIAVVEFTKVMQEIDSITFATVENYCVLAIGYLLLTYPISHFSTYLERKMAYGN